MLRGTAGSGRAASMVSTIFLSTQVSELLITVLAASSASLDSPEIHMAKMVSAHCVFEYSLQSYYKVIHTSEIPKCAYFEISEVHTLSCPKCPYFKMSGV